jgi:hypothetical protein
MTRQLDGPIRNLSLAPHNRMAVDVYHQAKKGRIVLDPPYQRGSVWTTDQRLDLMYSYLSGYPTGTLIFNGRGRWGNGGLGASYAVIDGRQRLETVIAWFDGELAIPSTWLFADDLTAGGIAFDDGIDTEDGLYVTVNHLTTLGASRIESIMSIPVVTAQVGSLFAEAEIYRLVNAGGTAHTTADLERAAQIENK